jgi:ribosomal protein S18 acetylase RimI-like enzyme
MIHYEIRNALEQDHPEINKLAVEAWQALKDGYDPDQWDGMLTAIGKMSNLAARGALIVAADQSSILGAVCYMPPKASNPGIFPDTWPSIRMLVTHPASRGMGIGRRLTEECISRALLDQADCIGLHTSPVMTVALPLYLRMGFVMDKVLSPIAGAPYARYVLKF